MSRGRLVSIRCPWRGFGACDVLREGLGDDRSMARSINLSDDVNTTLGVQEVSNTERKDKHALQVGKVVHFVGILDNLRDLSRSVDFLG